MKVPQLGKSLVTLLVLSGTVLFSVAAPVPRCPDPQFDVCSEDTRASIHDRLLVRDLMAKENPSFDFNITASVPTGILRSLEEDGSTGTRGQEGLTSHPCTKQLSPEQDRICQWSFHCDFNPLRLPTTIFQAQLIGSAVVKLNRHNKQTDENVLVECQCRRVTAPVTVLTFENCTADGKDEWTLASIPVGVSYSCARVAQE